MSKAPALGVHTPRATAPKTYTAVRGGLHYLRGNKLPYFSLACDIYERGRDIGGGADHKEILRHFPALKPLADLHLSDINGVPMHADANGWYWLAGTVDGGFGQEHTGASGSPGKSAAECLAIFARHVRVSDEEAASIREYFIDKARRDGNKAARELFAQWILDQHPRWKREADECISSLGLVVFGDDWNQS